MVPARRLLASPLAYAAAGGLVAIVVLAVATVSGFVAWQVAAGQAERSRNADRAVLGYAHSLLAAESALRGYLLTGQADNVASYNAALEDADEARTEAERLLEGNEGGLRLLADAARTGDAAVGEWRRLIVSRDAQGQAGSSIEERVRYVELALAPLRDTLGSTTGVASRRSAQMHTAFVAGAVLLAFAMAGTMLALATAALRERRSRLELETQLEREAQHDARTRLPNRKFFMEWAAYAVAGSRRDADGLGILMIAVDSGDVRLRTDGLASEIARRLRTLKRESDFLGRLDEQVYALAALHVKEAKHLAGLGQRIVRALSDPPLPGSKLATFVPCVGIAMFPHDADDVQGLIAAADSALATARHAGGRRVAFHGEAPASTPTEAPAEPR